MSEDRMIKVEEVESVEAPPKARVADVETAPEKLERKRDYLEGFLSQKPADLPAGQPGGATYDAIIDALKDIFDPEIPVDIYELGLIYEVRISKEGVVEIDMTLTSPNCPVAESLPKDVKEKVESVEGVTEAHVNIVFDPPWDKDMMSEEAKLELGFL